MTLAIFFVIFTLVLFSIFVFSRYKWGKDALFVVGIGCLIASNIYNVGSYPLVMFGLTFGIDSVIYTLGIFCILVMFIDYDKSSYRSLLYSGVGSILLTAFFAFVGNSLAFGFSDSLYWTALSYVFSVIGTLLAVWTMIWLYGKLVARGWNVYVVIAVCLLIASLINSAIYFGLNFIVTASLGENFLLTLAGSYIGKTFTIVFCLLAFFVGGLLTSRKKSRSDQIDAKK